jgi:hypothetical protein
MEQRESGLFVARSFNVTKLRPVVKTRTLPSGEKVQVVYEPTSLDGESSVTHIEHKDGRVDGIARPKTIRYRLKLGDPRGTRH